MPQKSADLSTATSTERLLLSQAVHQLGNGDFSAVFDLLQDHPLLNPSESRLSSTQDCKALYELLMRDASLEGQMKDGLKPKAKVHQELSKIHFQARVVELREAISQEEEKFKKLFNEIAEIKAGIWDERIRAEIQQEEASKKSSARGTKRKHDEAQVPDEASPENDKDSHDLEDEDVTLNTTKKGRKAPPANIKKPPTKGQRRSGRGQTADHTEDVSMENPLDSADAPTNSAAPSVTDEPVEDIASEEPLKSARNRGSRKASTKRKREGTEEDSVASPGLLDRNKKRAKTEDTELESPVPPTPAALGVPLTAPPEMDPATYKKWKASILQILQQINNQAESAIFREPVRKQDAPNYGNIILQAMDLKTIGKRIRDGTTTNDKEFRRDILLIFANAVMFNAPDSDVTLAAHELRKVTEELIHLHEVAS